MDFQANNRNFEEEAEKYWLMANFFQYVDPMKHLYYYKKYMNLSSQSIQMRNNSSVRFLHASPDAPAVDVYINDERTFTNVRYKNISEYVELPGGVYQVKVYPTGEKNVAVLTESLSVEQNELYTVGAIEEVNNINLFIWTDDPSVPTSETKFRFIHVSSDTPNVDIAVQGGDVVFSNVAFKEVTEYLGLTPMTVDLEVRVAGTKNVVLTLDRIKFRPDIGYTVIVVGFAEKKPGLETLFLVP
ncbi:DUF4397 domain-containing protein [Bacillus alkalisoli]|uniref:DUF4397 domain-containing protein n=1 Tax=Bacillus alkalisoli TaxID=2011008 RepID=UPI000C234D42|nr:DUF4397 domain-containing protein [Bacillus alkalisoli]